MKIVLLNYASQCIEVCPVNDAVIDENFDEELYLAEKGYDIDNCNWMLVDNDPDDIPVFWMNENIPYTNL